MNKRLRWLLSVLLITLVSLYPTSKKDALDLYTGTDKTPINGLASFFRT